jgi:hypothetical protein
MSAITIAGDTSGSVTLDAPAVAGTTVLTLPSTSGSVDAFPSGTRLLFQQTSAPTGWTKDVSHDNKALRVVSGTASSGGSVAFTTAFSSQGVSGTVGNTTLTTSQIPNHNHGRGVITTGGVANNPGIYIGSGAGAVFYTNGGSGFTGDGYGTDYTGGGGSHNHSFTGTAINLAVQYVDVIIAAKD